MAEFSIGEAERLTGVKAHVLRYWEEAVPFIRPKKDDQGRRVYSSRDIELILRLKYLVYERKFTLEGAGERLLRELTEPRLASARETVKDLRESLLDLYRLAKRDGSGGE